MIFINIIVIIDPILGNQGEELIKPWLINKIYSFTYYTIQYEWLFIYNN